MNWFGSKDKKDDEPKSFLSHKTAEFTYRYERWHNGNYHWSGFEEFTLMMKSGESITDVILRADRLIKELHPKCKAINYSRVSASNNIYQEKEQ